MKQGALDLSINSIVVIIFAITMLGLGLAFIRGQFSAIQEKITFPEPDIAATANEPIVLPFETLVVNRGTDAEFSINFYNNGAHDLIMYPEPNPQRLGDAFPFIGGCTPQGLETIVQGVNRGVVLIAAPQPVYVGQAASFKVLLQMPPSAGSGKYICSLQVGNDQWIVATKQFFVEVK